MQNVHDYCGNNLCVIFQGHEVFFVLLQFSYSCAKTDTCNETTSQVKI